MKACYLFCLLIATMLFCGCENSSFSENLISNETLTSETEITQTTKENFYWYHGEKIYLTEIANKRYILYNGKPASHSISNTTAKLYEIKMPSINLITKNKNKEEPYWAKIDGSNIQQARTNENDEIIYNSPYYTSPSGEEIGISHLFYVKLKDKADENILISFAEKFGVKVIGSNKYLPLWYTLSCDKDSYGNTLQMTNIFHDSNLFSVVEPDIMTPLQKSNSISNISLPNDTYFNKQWNLNGNYSINWPQAYNLSQGNNVEIAIIDQGVDAFNPDFPYQGGITGYDLVSGSLDIGNIVYGPHGTACAGIISATVNNNKGIAGIAPKATLISYCHPLTESPNTIQQLANGLSSAAMNYDVISCSWGGASLTSSLIEDALHYYAFTWGRNNKGTIVVFAAGNDYGPVSFPANCNDKILAVGAIGPNGKRCGFSNYGSQLDIVAPGDQIPTTDLVGEEGYSKSHYVLDFDGTSAACPHVAAVAALILSVNPDLKGTEVNDIIEQTARKVGGYSYTTNSNRPNGTWNNEMGYGLIDAYAAIVEAQKRKNK